MDQRTVKFIKRHHVLTLATAVDNTPYCANAFYAYDTKRNRLIFTSDISTRHGGEMLANNIVAASVVWETKLVGRIQGLQITGKVLRADADDASCYIKRFPYTALSDLTLWAIEPHMMKYTDNTLGFGTKLIWNVE
ncbi:MAG: pyridoxamine 5'-phosphate oxidase family protein [Rikenellaceae bacterium]